MAIQVLRTVGTTITPYIDAMCLYYGLGNCIFSGIGDECSVSKLADGITIGTGMGIVCGYQFRITAPVSLGATTSQYIYIHLHTSKDDTQNTIEFLPSLPNDAVLDDDSDIINNNGGDYYSRFSLLLSTPQPQFKIIEPGVAPEADTLTSNGYIGDVPFDQIFNDFDTADYPGVLNADRAATADVALGIGSSSSLNIVNEQLQVGQYGYLMCSYRIAHNLMIIGQANPANKEFTINTDLTSPESNNPPYALNRLQIFGKSGFLLCEVGREKLSNGDEFYADADNLNTHIIKFTRQDASNKLAFKVTIGIEDKQPVVISWTEWTRVEIIIYLTREAL